MEVREARAAARDEPLRYFELGEGELAATYGPGKWSVRFLLHHLADSEAVFNERIRKVLCEGRRVLWVYDQDAQPLARHLRGHAREPPVPGGRALRAARPPRVGAQRNRGPDAPAGVRQERLAQRASPRADPDAARTPADARRVPPRAIRLKPGVPRTGIRRTNARRRIRRVNASRSSKGVARGYASSLRWKPPRRYQVDALMRRWTCSFSRMLCTWFLAVATPMPSCFAISLLDIPWSTSLRMSCFRRVSSESGPAPSSVLICMASAPTRRSRVNATRGEQ